MAEVITFLSLIGVGIVIVLLPTIIDYIMEKYFSRHFPLNSGNKDYHTPLENGNQEMTGRRNRIP